MVTSSTRLALILLLVIQLALVATKTDEKDHPTCSSLLSDTNTCHATAPSQGECTRYMAPSTIPHAGLGVFTTTPLHKGDLVLPFGDVMIPIVAKAWHYGKKMSFWPLKNYAWFARDKGMAEETPFSQFKVEAYCPGMDALPNCHLALVNLQQTLPQYHNGGLYRARDVGAGSFTPYQNGTSVVTHDVPAGGELFTYYGDKWFVRRQDIYGLVPLKDDYKKASILIQAFMNLSLSNDAREDLFHSLIRKVPWESRTLNAVPSEFRDLELIAEKGMRAFHQQSAIHNTSFLQTNGRCIDNIISSPSTVKQAGRGAFATRLLPKDSIITGSPLLIVQDRNYLTMYKTTINREGRLRKDSQKLVGWQLLLNYCFGHAESSLLLCPYGSGVNFINHNDTRANAKIQWAPHGVISHNESYFNLRVDEVNYTMNTNLAIDYVALRDIYPDEEIFLHYGSEWHNAWIHHVETWKAPHESESYVDAATFNNKMKDVPLKSTQEQSADPYPSNLELKCHPVLQLGNWRSYLDMIVWNINHKGANCVILSTQESSDGENLYTVSIANSTGSNDRANRTIREVPRKCFKFFDKHGTTAIHLPSAFRHAIGIPDDMFPIRWRNRR